MLAKLYKKLKEDKKNVEMVFVSSDRSEESFGQYLDSMPWLAVPFGDSRVDQMKNLFAVDGIQIWMRTQNWISYSPIKHPRHLGKLEKGVVIRFVCYVLSRK